MSNNPSPTNSAFTYDQATAAAARAGETVVPSFCAMCGPSPGCGIYAFVRDGRFDRVAGMAECPTNRGSVCVKGHAGPQWLYSPDRLTKPLLRRGAKGEGVFWEISWDEALDILADKLKEQKQAYGPESLAILSPARRTYSELLQRFLIAHGSPNYGHSGICALQRIFSFSYTIGGMPSCDYPNAELIVLWGRQPIYSGPAMAPARAFVDAKKRGARIVAVKPSVEPDAGMADEWIPLRPGTDAALALGMLHVVIQENLIDADFVRDWCYGYDALREHIRQYTPEWAETITGVPAGQIEAFARAYATTEKAVIDLGNGVEHAPSSSDAIRAVAILMAVTGHLDRPGCNLLGGPPGGGAAMPRPISLFERYTAEMIDKLVAPEFPKAFQPFIEGTTSAYFRVLESVLTEDPYPVRAVIAPGTQPTVSTRGTKRVIDALKKLDFYTVIDVIRTADMDYADLVIPTTTPYESDHPFEMRGPWLMARNKIVEPLGDFKSITELILELAVRMGYGEDFWHGDATAMQNYQLEPLDLTIDALRAMPTGKFLGGAPPERTFENYARAFSSRSTRLDKGPYLPEGKVALYNTTFAQAGYSPMPVWHDAPESPTATPELLAQYPLMLSDYHTSKTYTASWQRNVPILREICPYPTVHIHPDTAEARGIHDGDWVVVESMYGSIRVKAEFYPGIRPDTVMILHGWWQGCSELGYDDLPLEDGGANVNNLYSVDPDKVYDPLITAMSSQTLVEVRRDEQ